MTELIHNWGHPQLRPNHLPMTGNAKRLSDPNLTLEEKEEYQQMVYENTKRMMEQMDDGRYDKDFELKVFMVPGCEEEPDAPLAEDAGGIAKGSSGKTHAGYL